jgi:hypothetical protein
MALTELDPCELSEPDLDIRTGRFASPTGALGWSTSFFDDGTERGAVAEVDGTIWFRFLGELLCRCTRPSQVRPWMLTIAEDVDLPLETLRHLVIDEIIPMLLASDGSPVLHGAAVAVDHRAVVFLGDSGMGKSTLSIALAQRGAALLSDDCIVLDRSAGQFLAQPSYPSVRVWDSAARQLFGDERVGEPFVHYTEKRRYRDGLRFASAPEPVTAVGVLHYEWGADSVSVEPIRGHAASAAVVGAARTLPLGKQKLTTIESLLDLSERVPVVKVTLPDDISRLPHVASELVKLLADRALA